MAVPRGVRDLRSLLPPSGHTRGENVPLGCAGAAGTCSRLREATGRESRGFPRLSWSPGGLPHADGDATRATDSAPNRGSLPLDFASQTFSQPRQHLGMELTHTQHAIEATDSAPNRGSLPLDFASQTFSQPRQHLGVELTHTQHAIEADMQLARSLQMEAEYELAAHQPESRCGTSAVLSAQNVGGGAPPARRATYWRQRAAELRDTSIAAAVAAPSTGSVHRPGSSGYMASVDGRAAVEVSEQRRRHEQLVRDDELLARRLQAEVDERATRMVSTGALRPLPSGDTGNVDVGEAQQFVGGAAPSSDDALREAMRASLTHADEQRYAFPALGEDVIERSTVTMRHRASAVGADESSKSCAICCEAFVENASVRMLPCMHKYHVDCVDQWLARSGACPVCKYVLVVT